MEKVLGVLAGIGHLPVDVVLGAKEAGYKVVVIGVVPDTNVELPKVADNFFSVNINFENGTF